MKSNGYFDQLTVCDDDFEIMIKLLKSSFPNLIERDIELYFKSNFATLPSLLSTNYSVLQESNIIGCEVASFLKYMYVIVNIYNKSRIRDRDLINNIEALNHYLHVKLSPLSTEQILLLTLTGKNHLIKEELIATGTSNRVEIHPQQILKSVLAANAPSFILVHNHPSGDPKPSERDVVLSCRLQEICRDLEITFHDHIIVGHDRILSMRRDGYL